MAWLSESVEYVSGPIGAKKFYMVRGENKETHFVGVMPFKSDTDAYFEWLGTLHSFRFVGHQGSFTARQETIIKREQGTQYWYAYRKAKGAQVKRYLGATNKLSTDFLEESARHIEETLKQKLGVDSLISPRQEKLTDNERVLLRRIEKQETTIAEQATRIQWLENKLKELEAVQ